MAKAHIKTVFEHDNIIRSENDNRQYRGLELNNGMKILLVSDQETDKSAAAMDVNIGHMKDPRDIPGIAHFCEHMLFLGTEKFLNEHGGGSNAFTSLEHTNFYFDVAPESLSGALDSQFYSSNIMALAVVGKESLDQLTEMVVPLFCGVENKSVTVPEWLDAPAPYLFNEFNPDLINMILEKLTPDNMRVMVVSKKFEGQTDKTEQCPYAYIDPLHANLSYMFVGLFKDALNEYSYAAEIAGLHYNLDCSPYGVYLEVKGYNHKLDILLKKIMERLTTFVVDPQRFDIIKEAYERGLRNFRAEQPHQHAVYYTSVLMSEVVWTKDELLQALEVSGLFKGSLPEGCYYLYQQQNEVHNSSCIEIYYQCGLQKTETNMLLELFCQIIGDQCFDTLRTKEQLGYIVFSGVRRSKGVQGLRVIVQSDRPPMYVEGRVEAFLQKMEEELKKLSEEDFQKHVSALATKRLELPKRLAVQNAKFWSEIISQQYNFDRDNVEVAFLRKITKDDLYQFYKDMIAHDAPRRHKLSVHIVSQAGDQEPVVVTDEVDFKRNLPLYPLAKPFIDLSKARSKL
nr:hypothetical protein BaRGS_032218 [Batillaria attramentaria]